jgi:hypothetical protein
MMMIAGQQAVPAGSQQRRASKRSFKQAITRGR